MRNPGKIWVNEDELNVPPMECAWLSNPEQRVSGHGCVWFEVAGTNDATVIWNRQPGSRRWQHSPGSDCPTDDTGYTVIIGSNRNSRLKIERGGAIVCEESTEWATIKPHEFRSFWIHVGPAGEITVGAGRPGCPSDSVFFWKDPSPLDGITSIGLSSWDRQVRYRNIHVDPEMEVPVGCWVTRASPSSTPRLYDIAAKALLGDLSVETALGVLTCLQSVQVPGGEVLCRRAAERLAKAFDEVAEDPSCFSELTCGTLATVLKSPALMAKEMAMFRAIANWSFYGNDHPGRESHVRPEEELNLLIKLISFQLMEEAELKDVLHHPLVERCPLLLDLVNKAKAKASWSNPIPASIEVANRREVRSSQHSTARRRPQVMPHCRELVYSFDGDQQGVCHDLGTNHGTKDWVNPMVTNKVRVQASSPPGRCTNVKNVVDKKFSKTSYAAPRRENGQLASWWLVDLLEHTLICNYYTIRHDGSLDFMREWAFQGSNDGENWMDLKQHTSDLTFHTPAQFASFSVDSKDPYRMFRILLTGPTVSLTNSLNLCLSNMELYGTLLCPGMC